MDRRRRWRVSNGRRGCNMRRRRPGRWRRCPAESCGRCRSMRGWRLRRMNHRRRNRTGGCRARSCAPGSLGRGRGMGSWSPRRARKRSRSWPRWVDRRRRGLSTAIFPRRSALSDRRARQVMRRAGLRQRGSLPRGLRSGWRRVLRPGLRRVLRRGGCEGRRFMRHRPQPSGERLLPTRRLHHRRVPSRRRRCIRPRPWPTRRRRWCMRHRPSPMPRPLPPSAGHRRLRPCMRRHPRHRGDHTRVTDFFIYIRELVALLIFVSW